MYQWRIPCNTLLGSSALDTGLPCTGGVELRNGVSTGAPNVCLKQDCCWRADLCRGIACSDACSDAGHAGDSALWWAGRYDLHVCTWLMHAQIRACTKPLAPHSTGQVEHSAATTAATSWTTKRYWMPSRPKASPSESPHQS